MAEVLRSPQAHLDLLDIWSYIAEGALDAADRVIDSIAETCEMLAELPGMGRKRYELSRGLRSFPVGRHVIFYRPCTEGIEVIRVLHGARDMGGIFGARARADHE